MRLDVVHTRLIDISAIYSDAGTEVIGHKWLIQVEATFSPDNVSFDHDPRPAPVAKADAWGRPVGVLQTTRPQGRASAIRTMNSIREALLEPKKKLLVMEYSSVTSGEGMPPNAGSQHPLPFRPTTDDSLEIMLESPPRGESIGPLGGPTPIGVTVREVVGMAQAFLVTFQIEATTTAKGVNESDANSILLSNSYEVSTALDERYAAIRRTRGTAVFNASAVARMKVAPDAYRSNLFARIPLGCPAPRRRGSMRWG